MAKKRTDKERLDWLLYYRDLSCMGNAPNSAEWLMNRSHIDRLMTEDEKAKAAALSSKSAIGPEEGGEGK